jgi:hypothetical protein
VECEPYWVFHINSTRVLFFQRAIVIPTFAGVDGTAWSRIVATLYAH